MEVHVNENIENSDNIELNDLNSQTFNSPSESRKDNRRSLHRILTVICCSIWIVIAWLVAFSSTFMLVIQAIVTQNLSDAIASQDLLDELPPINLSNLSNYSIYSINCENSFVYEPRESICYPPCYWDPSETGMTLVINIIYFVISVSALILCVGTLISWIAASVKCRGRKRGCDFQLARASLFMVVLTKLLMYIMYTCIDVIGRYGLVCRTNEYGEQYLIAHEIFSVSSNPDTRLKVNILGQVYTFLHLSSSLWIIFGFTNVTLLVFFPLRIGTTLKRQVLTFCIEMGIAVILPICLLSIVTGVDPISTFSVNYLVQEIYPGEQILVILTVALVYTVTSGYVLTAVIIILTKLRFVSLRSERITGQGTQLTELEKRMVIYAVALYICYGVLGFNVALYLTIEVQFIAGVIDYTLCINVNSLITLTPLEYTGMINNISSLNSTLSVYRDNTVGNLTQCEVILSELNSTIPMWSIAVIGIITRIEGMLVFIVLIPSCSINCCKKLFVNKLITQNTKTSRTK